MVKALRSKIIIAVIVAVVLPLYAYKLGLHSDYTDFDVYYRAALRAHQGNWEQVYTLGDGASPFRYMPLWLPFFLPFLALSLEKARIVWYLCQFSFFTAALWLIFKFSRSVLRNSAQAWAVTALTSIFILRFCLDTFTIGQVSSVMFLGFTISVIAWSVRQAFWAGAGLSIPTLFKIGPGFLYSFFALGRLRERVAALLAPLLIFLGLNLITLFWLGSVTRFKALWENWWTIVINDSTYYDASHYGSQSVKSALLRFSQHGVISPAHVTSAYLTLAALGCASILLFYFLRAPRGVLGRALFCALGLFPYLWFMPETFKYSLSVLAIPVALIWVEASFSKKWDRSTIFVLVWSYFTLSFAGLDIVGPKLFFGLQRASIPLLSSFLLGLVIFRLCRRYSHSSYWGQRLGRIWNPPSLGPWAKTPGLPTQDVNWIITLPLGPNSPLTRLALDKKIREAKSVRASTEMVFAPYGDLVSEADPILLFLREKYPEIKCAPITLSRGLALREAFFLSPGNSLWIWNLEQPCGADFFPEATALLKGKVSLVRANRRLKESRFVIPVRLLPFVYGRHQLGLIFNRLVRAVLPLDVTDTQSGSAVLTRNLALAAFAVQSSQDFLFELEISLSVKARDEEETSLPVVIELPVEKSVERVALETLSILRSLPRLRNRFKSGVYAPLSAKALERLHISADDWGITPAVNEGILSLARQGVIRRASILSESKYASYLLPELLSIPGFSLGLHFNLTYGKISTSPGGLLKLWLFSGKRQQLADQVRRELEQQLNRLETLGVTPSYLDGHHHVHVIPGMLETIAPILKKYGISQLRLPMEGRLLFSKRAPLIIMAWLARGTFRKNAIHFHPFFYPGPKHFQDIGFFRSELQRRPGYEVIVHPATRGDSGLFEHPDSYTDERVIEFQALCMLAVR